MPYSETDGFRLFRGPWARLGAVVFFSLIFLSNMNQIVEGAPITPASLPFQFGLPSSWHHILLGLNILFYGYVIWLSIAVMKTMSRREERIIFACIACSIALGGMGFLISNSGFGLFARDANTVLWFVAALVSIRVAMQYRRGTMAAPLSIVRRSFLAECSLFVGATAFATAGVMLAVAVSLKLASPSVHAVFPAVSKEAMTALNFLPYFPLQTCLALVAGFFIGIQFRSRSIFFVWTIPLVVTALYLSVYQADSVFQSSSLIALSRLFGTNCHPPNCYDQALVTAPLYLGIAFSFGAWLRAKRIFFSSNPPQIAANDL